MKEINEEVLINNTRYQCDECKKTYSVAWLATDCELRHGCKHSELEYSFIEFDCESYCLKGKGIRKACKTCTKTFGEVEFEDMDGNQELMQQVFNLINKTPTK